MPVNRNREKNEVNTEKSIGKSSRSTSIKTGVNNARCRRTDLRVSLNTVLYKWSQPEAPEGQQVPVDAVNHATFVDPKTDELFTSLRQRTQPYGD